MLLACFFSRKEIIRNIFASTHECHDGELSLYTYPSFVQPRTKAGRELQRQQLQFYLDLSDPASNWESSEKVVKMFARGPSASSA